MNFQKYDPRVRYFNVIIEAMKDTGIMDYIFRYSDPYVDIPYVRPIVEEKLHLEHCYLPLAFVASGMLIGTAVFTSEKCSSRKIFFLRRIAL